MKLVVELKVRYPNYGCEGIANLLSEILQVRIDDQMVRRILRKHWSPDGKEPSWLTFLGHTKDSLWSVDFFCCESIHLRTHWVMIVMDQFTRKIIGFAVHKGPVNGPSLCLMFAGIIGKSANLPKRLSFDNDPLFRYFQWRSNLRIWDIAPIRSVPECPTSHPFIERLIRTVREEYLDLVFFWNAEDLQRKLQSLQQYYNHSRVHQSHQGKTPGTIAKESRLTKIDFSHYKWQSHCRGLYSLPVAA